MSEGARAVREALRDPLALCDALGLLDGVRGRHWFVDGRDRLRIRCPWHQETTGSCSVSLGADGTIRAKCFACDASGDALALIAVAHELDVRRDFARVLEIGAELAGIAVPAPQSHLSPRREAPPSRAPRAHVVVEEKETHSVELVAGALRTLAPVTRSREAMAYLRARRIAEHGAALGWIALPSAEPELDALRHQVVELVGADAWMACGMAWRSGCFDPRWRGRLVTPWEAPNGAVEYLVGRRITPCEKAERYCGLAGRAARWPYGCANLYELAGPDTAVAFVEGAIDALSLELWTQSQGADVRCLAIPGVSNWRASWAVLARGRDAIIALDADAQGHEHAPRLSADLKREARTVRRWKPAHGKDWNELMEATK